MKTLKFTNNDSIDAIGLGTWKNQGESVKNAVKTAIEVGYRHIDTASIYGNEADIGEALAEVFSQGLVRREDLFITSKLWNDAHQKEHVTPAIKESLEKLQLQYLDLYLIHWPVAFVYGNKMPDSADGYISLEDCPLIETWQQMEHIKQEGLAKHIGVSNFSEKKLKELVGKASCKPEMNQVELHPYLQQTQLLNYCASENILVTAYSPLGSGDRSEAMKADDEPNLLELPPVKDIAKKHNVTPAQVLINWHLQRETVVIPKANSKEHIMANFEAAKIQLDADDLRQIADIKKQYRLIHGRFFDAPEKGYQNLYDE